MSRAGEFLEGIAEYSRGVYVWIWVEMICGLGSVFNSGGDVEYMGGSVKESIFKLGLFHVFLDDVLCLRCNGVFQFTLY